MKRARQAAALVRHLGPRWALFRVAYALRQRSGWDARHWPSSNWEEWPLAKLVRASGLAEPDAYTEYRQKLSRRFFFSSEDRAGIREQLRRTGGNTVEVADRITRGEFRFFEHSWIDCGFPPDWHCNYLTGQTTPKQLHWSQTEEFGYGDIKAVWELSRFGWVYPLVRAYWRTGEDRYAEGFWRLVEDWLKHNPPQQGVNWKCGQEASFRVMACCFGLYGFSEAAATTGERVVRLARMLGVTGGRIAGNLDYALSQRNNHGVSEATGLWTLGLLFPEFREAGRWLELGREALEGQARELIYTDGSFSQHSANYHRVMLQDYVWALRLGELNEQPLSKELRERVGRAAEFLFQIQDSVSGRVPCYGQNDGALILPLSNCDYQDFRPVVQLARYASQRARTFGAGLWDEDLLWLFGSDALQGALSVPAARDLNAEAGGCYTLRGSDTFAFIHCPRFEDRPSQADALHVDLWWRGENIATDAGTYSYNAAAPWDNGLSGTAPHNTVLVDGVDQMDRAGKFLWLPWLKATKRAQLASSGGKLAYWEGEQDGYKRLRPAVRHRRAVVRLGTDHWLVLDKLESCGPHRYRLHWLFSDYAVTERPGELLLETPQGKYQVLTRAFDLVWSCQERSLESVVATDFPSPRPSPHPMGRGSELGAACRSSADDVAEGGMRAGSEGPLNGKYSLVRADETSVEGWRAPYYQSREAALSWSLEVEAETCWFWTLLGPPSCSVTRQERILKVAGPGIAASVSLAADRAATLVGEVSLGQTDGEKLVVS